MQKFADVAEIFKNLENWQFPGAFACFLHFRILFALTGRRFQACLLF